MWFGTYRYQQLKYLMFDISQRYATNSCEWHGVPLSLPDEHASIYSNARTLESRPRLFQQKSSGRQIQHVII